MEVSSIDSLVLKVLEGASSQNPDILKPAEEKLKEWETQSGFYRVLCNIISNQTLDVNVRWIAVLYMKNGIDKYWRKNAPNAICEEEKTHIRQQLLLDFSEPINQIAVQRAVLISKIARMDCSNTWPELFPTLIQAVESPDSFVQHRALLTLYHVVKAVSSKRLMGDRKKFQEFTGNIFAYVLNLWNNLTDAFIRDIMQNAAPEQIAANLEKALLTLRVLRKLTVFGFRHPHQSQDCMTFVKLVFEKIKTVLECYKIIKVKGPKYPIETCEKFIVHLTKILLALLDIHPFSFVDLIQPSLEFTTYYLFTDEGITFLFERFIIQCFNLIKSIVLCVEYRPMKVIEATKYPETIRANTIVKGFLQPQVLTDICRKLIVHYFILTPQELETWDCDPEAFANDEGGDSWRYSLRPSMETLFFTLFHEYKEVVIPLLLELVNECNVLIPPENMQQILWKDAVYNAITMCAFELYDEVNFDNWFANTLLAELKIKHKNYRVIRRRATSLIGRWTNIKLSSELRPILYDCLISLLGPEEDMAVRLTAVTSMRYAIDDFEFSSDVFKDYMFPAFDALFVLLKDSVECETKMHVLNVMTLLLERMGNTLQPQVDSLTNYLPHLWQESEDHNMLRCAIVATLVQIVKGMGGVKPELSQFLLPIIQLGTDTNQCAIVYLLEDALDLWLAVLEFSPAMTTEFMQLFNNMLSLLEYSTENFRGCILICCVQLLLAPELVMRTYGTRLITICDQLMTDLKNEGVIMLVRLLETFVRVIPMLGSETIMPILPRIFSRIYKGDDYHLVMSMLMSLMARVLLSSHDVFTRVLAKVAEMHNENNLVTLGKILDVWLNKMPNVSQLDQRKLLGLALTNLLTTQSSPVLERFHVIMINILETLNDITKTDDTEEPTLVDSLVLMEGQSPSYFDEDACSYYDTDHDQRKKQLILVDPVHTIVLKDYLQTQLFQLQNQIGTQQYQQLLQVLDADTVSQLKEYVKLLS